MFVKMRSCMFLLGVIVQVSLSNGKLNQVCTLPKDPGPCKAYFPRYFFNTVSNECEPFVYGGCHGNKNNFETEAECVKTCECGLDVDAGSGDQKLTRWYFKRNKCRAFKYLGTGGNANNFLTKEQCRSACKSCV